MANTCPICEKGTLVEQQGHNTIPYKGFRLNVPFVYSRCTQCESEQATGEQITQNKQACLDMKIDVNVHINQLMASTF